MTVSQLDDPASRDIESLIEAIGELDDSRRVAALAVLAHHLTVEIRLALDEPFPARGADLVRQLNEFLHQLTSRLHPADQRLSEDDKSLLRAFAADAARAGKILFTVISFERAVGHYCPIGKVY